MLSGPFYVFFKQKMKKKSSKSLRFQLRKSFNYNFYKPFPNFECSVKNLSFPGVFLVDALVYWKSVFGSF